MSGRKVQVRRDAQGIHLDDGVNVRGLNRDETAALETFFATDHSMCARLVANDSRTYPWVMVHPNGAQGGCYLTERARELGYPVPDTRTVEERVAATLRELDVDDDLLDSMAARLAELGLLAKDGETNG